jgi:hypothetical protein
VTARHETGSHDEVASLPTLYLVLEKTRGNVRCICDVLADGPEAALACYGRKPSGWLVVAPARLDLVNLSPQVKLPSGG